MKEPSRVPFAGRFIGRFACFPCYHPHVQKSSYHSLASHGKMLAFHTDLCRREAAEWMKIMEQRPEYEQLFEAPFNMEEYVETRLRDIENLEERRFAKGILEGCLLKGFQQMERRYNQLEKRIYDELECSDSKYSIYTTIIPREVYDPIGDFLYPICQEDLPPDSYDTEAILEQMEAGTRVELSRVFFKQDYPNCQTIENRIFAGKLLLDGDRELKAEMKLFPDKRYIKAVEQFYELYCNNGITWTTVNTAYMEKCFSLVLERVEGTLTKEDKVVGFTADLEDLAAYANYNHLPLWNVQKQIVESADFMVPCVDSVGWKHKVSVVGMGIENEYLIQVTDAIRSFRRERDDIVILTDGQEMPVLVVYKIAQRKQKLPLGYDYPVLNNSKSDCFTRRYTEYCNKSLLTRAELLRRIHELDFEMFLEFQQVEFQESKRFEPQTYSMNPFVNDEIVNKTSKKLLRFTFREKTPGYFLNLDMLSFLISQLQLSFNEYRCEGILTDGGTA